MTSPNPHAAPGAIPTGLLDDNNQIIDDDDYIDDALDDEAPAAEDREHRFNPQHPGHNDAQPMPFVNDDDTAIDDPVPPDEPETDVEDEFLDIDEEFFKGADQPSPPSKEIQPRQGDDVRQYIDQRFDELKGLIEKSGRTGKETDDFDADADLDGVDPDDPVAKLLRAQAAENRELKKRLERIETTQAQRDQRAQRAREQQQVQQVLDQCVDRCASAARIPDKEITTSTGRKINMLQHFKDRMHRDLIFEPEKPEKQIALDLLSEFRERWPEHFKKTSTDSPPAQKGGKKAKTNGTAPVLGPTQTRGGTKPGSDNLETVQGRTRAALREMGITQG